MQTLPEFATHVIITLIVYEVVRLLFPPESKPALPEPRGHEPAAGGKWGPANPRGAQGPPGPPRYP
jgi:hypothetical protein